MNKTTKITLMQLLFPAAYAVIFYFLNQSQTTAPLLNTVLFLAGMYIGEGLIKLDQMWLFKYYMPEEQQQSQSQQEIRSGEKKLITRSILFVLSLFPLSLFMITSTGSSLGVGVLLGVALGLAIEMFVYKQDKEVFQDRFLFQLKKPLSAKDIEWYFWIFVIFSAVLSILIVF